MPDMQEDMFGLSPIWDAVLDIYAVFDGICEKHGLRNYISDGALLGAVRHGGFIPWDDDLDVSMPREDYEKFIQIAKSELPPHLKFVYWKNTPEFTLSFGKIQDVREDRIKAIEAKTGRMLSNGLYIDIFPIDGYPPNGFEALWIRMRDAFLLVVERFHLYKFSQLSSKGKRGWLLGMFCSVLVPWMWRQHQFLALHDHSLRRYPFNGAKLVGRACQRMNVFRRAPMSADVWGEPQGLYFAGRMVKAPQKIQEYLVSEYGSDYMTPPPEEKRRPGHSYSWRCPWWLGPTKTDEHRAARL